MVFRLEISELTREGSRIRCVASQILACMSSYLLLLDLGMAISFPTIAVPDLLHAKEGLSLDDTQTSWFGSLAFLTQPFGALISGPIVDYFGRRKASLLVNIPHLIGWTLMYFSWNLPSLFIANALLGLGTGVMEAPINAYPGEIGEPSIRGSLCSTTQFFVAVGTCIMYFFGTVLSWRYAALICLVVPFASMLMLLLVVEICNSNTNLGTRTRPSPTEGCRKITCVLFQQVLRKTRTPETPVWLLAKGRDEDAMKSLCKLRGWTKPEVVQEEFGLLKAYSEKVRQCVICLKTEKDTKICEHETINRFKRSMLKFRYVMLCKENLRPLKLVVLYFLFFVMCSVTPVKPSMVNVCGAFGMAEDGKKIVLLVGILALVSSFVVIGLIKVVGKRKLAISSMFCSSICCVILSIYANKYLDNSVFSYDTSTYPKELSYVPLVLFYLLAILYGMEVPWVILGEVFPFRSRGASQGISAASNYAFSFIGTKTFINLETSFKLWGTFAIYAVFGLIGTIYLYFFLPETENKTLEEVETFFSGKFKIFPDDPVFNFFKRSKRKVTLKTAVC